MRRIFEIPTPNCKKYEKVEYVDLYGEVVELSARMGNKDSEDRWCEVEVLPKVLTVEKYKPPPYIEQKRGRPPTQTEDYCPNCFEILPLSIPLHYTNCSGCLSRITHIDTFVLQTRLRGFSH